MTEWTIVPAAAGQMAVVIWCDAVPDNPDAGFTREDLVVTDALIVGWRVPSGEDDDSVPEPIVFQYIGKRDAVFARLPDGRITDGDAITTIEEAVQATIRNANHRWAAAKPQREAPARDG